MRSAGEERLIIVSNRLPVTVSVTDGQVELAHSVGGLSTGLRGPHERSDGLWIGWPGAHGDMDPDAAVELDRQLRAQRIRPVDLTPDEHAIFYERIANGVLWPAFHDRLDQIPLVIEGWDVYERVNARFADAVAEHYRSGDLVWVHDYQLMRVPALLRERIPDARIGFFLHIPFPNPEIFTALPTRRWLVDGLLGADVIGFHTRRYRGHFAAVLRRILGAEVEDLGGARPVVVHGDRRIALGVFPISVDACYFSERATAPDVAEQAAALKAGEERLLVGIDRLDYSKGIPRRLLAFEHLLATHPEWRERVRLVQVAVPSRVGVGAYDRFRRELDELVGRINGRFATPRWTPIHYLYRSVPETMLLALYRAADLMLVTPVRDGMNLVAKEFVASRTDEDGVLVLSEFAGAAAELCDAVIVNPYDVHGTAAALHGALTMPDEERRARMRIMRAQVATHDVHCWASSFLEALAGSVPPPAP